MSKLVWDEIGERHYETGVDHGVLYLYQNGAYAKGVPWNGLSTVNESPSGAEASPIYADNMKYLNLISAEEFGATIEAYTAPDEFAECDGSVEIMPGMFVGQQARSMFGFSYRTLLGNDTEGDSYGYRIHLVYGCLAAPSEKSHSSINDNPEAVTLSWEVKTTPVTISKTIDGKKLKPVSHMYFDSTKFNEDFMNKLEDILYGKDVTESESDASEPRLPMPDELIELFQNTLG